MLPFNLPDGQEPHLSRYIRFIQTRKIRKLQECIIMENHHILPKSFGGVNTQDNLIKLSLREHFIAHLILWKCYKGKMTSAFWVLRSRGHKIKELLTSRQFQRLEEDHRQFAQAKIGAKNPFYGRHHTEQTKEAVRQSNKRRSGFNHHFYGKVHPNKGKHNKNTKYKIFCIETQQEFKSILEASKKIHIKRDTIYTSLREHRQVCHRYTFLKIQNS